MVRVLAPPLVIAPPPGGGESAQQLQHPQQVCEVLLTPDLAVSPLDLAASPLDTRSPLDPAQLGLRLRKVLYKQLFVIANTTTLFYSLLLSLCFFDETLSFLFREIHLVTKKKTTFLILFRPHLRSRPGYTFLLPIYCK